MKYFYPALHRLHKPSIDLSDGLPAFDHMEIADRVDLILSGLQKVHPAEVVYVEGKALEAVKTIHDHDYIDFLLNISKEIEGDKEYIPSVFRNDLSSSPLYFQGGMYCDEIGTPIGKESVNAALNSAQTALDATRYMIDNATDAFALTRPPGHHAGKRRYGGYCFFNNAYLAANLLVEYGKKAAVVDIDYHIGDGSPEFATETMPYYSLHSDPWRSYPYLEADFSCDNEHVTLRQFKTGISGETYIENVRSLLDEARESSPDAIILSLGFDTLGTDYCQDEYIYVKPEDFEVIGEMFGHTAQQTLLLLEGGYDADHLEACGEHFMRGFMQGRGKRMITS